MEKSICKLLKVLKIELACAALMVVIVAFLGVFGVIPNGVIASQEHNRIAFTIKIIAILFTILGALFVIRLFELNTDKTIHRYTLDGALKTYHIWSFIRIVILTIAAVFGMVTYFLTMDNMGLLCTAVVILLAVIYCVPSKEKLKAYLDKAKDNNENN